MNDLEPRRQCIAHNRAGDRCGRAPIPGGNVCVMHGGAIPAVKKAARERLLEMVEPALEALRRVLESHGPPCELCGRSDADRDPTVVRAAQIILDRTGFGPGMTLEVVPAASTDLSQLSLAEMADRAEATARSLRAQADAEAAEADAIDVDLNDALEDADAHLD